MRSKMIRLNLDHYEAFYQRALNAQKCVYAMLPRCENGVEELQCICRVCGCHDDGTFTSIDANQNFEFDSSIPNYRVLFQRTSLQFQFHTMPDLPSKVCAECGYKVKTFYLLTRQFVHSQHAMRAVITEWYRNEYSIEPPELSDDRDRIIEQVGVCQYADDAAVEEKPSLKSDSIDIIRARGELPRGERKRTHASVLALDDESQQRISCSSATHVDSKSQTERPKAMTKTGQPTKKLSQKPEMDSKAGHRNKAEENKLMRRPISTQRIATCMSRPSRTFIISNKELISRAVCRRRECITTPRYKHGQMEASAKKAGKQDQSVQVTNFPPSKAELQRKLKERRKQWRV